MAQFHETTYGKRFFDSQLPALIKALERTYSQGTGRKERR